MDDTEGMRLDPANLSAITINGTTVPVFEQSGRRWYQLITLLKALEFPEAGLSSLPTKLGSQFGDGEEFLKYKDTWYGTAEGLSLYMEDLRIFQYLPTGSSKDKQTARVRQLILQQWLPSLGGGGGTTATAEGSIECESNANAVPLPTETNNEQAPTNGEKPEPMDMPTAKLGAIDLALFDRMYDNLSARIPYLASRLPISNNASAGEKMFAVLTVGFLYPNELIVRPQDDSDGIWGQEQFLCMSEAIRRSMLFGQ